MPIVEKGIERPAVRLKGPEGNAFFIMAKMSRWIQKHGAFNARLKATQAMLAIQGLPTTNLYLGTYISSVSYESYEDTLRVLYYFFDQVIDIDVTGMDQCAEVLRDAEKYSDEDWRVFLDRLEL